ncbi:hypothetical protein HMPREF9225_0398 [Peptoniphilus duerdenii ATCC BAA-1640]|uniref:Uncharacterized protein n=1 Tax=Peptoniphilus duerdenii ATCC BAA-1640 TaxID=862517 RepID=E0NJQ9_9FIRM|nr:hypothetical protein HMPREF9225_0398 [Peptoniphilus duerdenii ATCC BAA-1640]
MCIVPKKTSEVKADLLNLTADYDGKAVLSQVDCLPLGFSCRYPPKT